MDYKQVLKQFRQNLPEDDHLRNILTSVFLQGYLAALGEMVNTSSKSQIGMTALEVLNDLKNLEIHIQQHNALTPEEKETYNQMLSEGYVNPYKVKDNRTKE